ncbi:MAG: 7TM domain-containing protein [Erythrobacter sp.]
MIARVGQIWANATPQVRRPFYIGLAVAAVLAVLGGLGVANTESFIALPSTFEGVAASQAIWGLKPSNLLMVLPLGAFLVVLARSFIGLKAFGLFTPMLIALAFLQIGPVLGPVVLCSWVLVGMIEFVMVSDFALALIEWPPLLMPATTGIAIAILGRYRGLRLSEIGRFAPIWLERRRRGKALAAEARALHEGVEEDRRQGLPDTRRVPEAEPVPQPLPEPVRRRAAASCRFGRARRGRLGRRPRPRQQRLGDPRRGGHLTCSGF